MWFFEICTVFILPNICFVFLLWVIFSCFPSSLSHTFPLWIMLLHVSICDLCGKVIWPTYNHHWGWLCKEATLKASWWLLTGPNHQYCQYTCHTCNRNWVNSWLAFEAVIAVNTVAPPPLCVDPVWGQRRWNLRSCVKSIVLVLSCPHIPQRLQPPDRISVLGQKKTWLWSW